VAFCRHWPGRRLYPAHVCRSTAAGGKDQTNRNLSCQALGRLGHRVVWRRYGWNLGSVALVTYCSLLLLIAVIDLEHRLVPNVLVGSGMVMALGFSLISAHLGLATTLWGALVGGGTFMLLSLARRGALGAGDVKLAALIGMMTIGMMTGYPGVLLALTLGIILGGLAAGLFLLTGVKRRDQYMPYAPYLTAGSAATLLWSQQIASWYVSLTGLGG